VSDDIDLAQAHEEMHRAIAAAAARTKTQGSAVCVECAEPISPYRQELGADRCIDCQTALEKRAAHRRAA
jgi:RNA polymerase-binding transcription factor DksA